MYKCLIYITLVLFLSVGCDNTAGPNVTNTELSRMTNISNIGLIENKDKFILLVGGQEITSDDIIYEPTMFGETFLSPAEYLEPVAQAYEIELFKAQTRDWLKQIIKRRISYVVLYQNAKRQLGDNLDDTLENATESEFNNFIQRYGGDIAKADEIIKQNWGSRRNYKNLIKRNILEYYFVSSKTPTNEYISYRKLKDKYEEMKDEHFAKIPSIEFRLIDIQPSKIKITDPNQDQRKVAENLADQIFTKLKSGEDFAELAKQYSHGPRKESGGLWRPVNPNSLVEPYDLIAKAADNLNSGEISEPIKTEQRIFIVKLESKISAGYEPFENVQDQVKEALLSEQQSNTAINKLNEQVEKQMELQETNKFVNFCLEKIHQINNQ